MMDKNDDSHFISHVISISISFVRLLLCPSHWICRETAAWVGRPSVNRYRPTIRIIKIYMECIYLKRRCLWKRRHGSFSNGWRKRDEEERRKRKPWAERDRNWTKLQPEILFQLHASLLCIYFHFVGIPFGFVARFIGEICIREWVAGCRCDFVSMNLCIWVDCRRPTKQIDLFVSTQEQIRSEQNFSSRKRYVWKLFSKQSTTDAEPFASNNLIQ